MSRIVRTPYGDGIISGIAAIAQGGTGAQTADAALANLGGLSAALGGQANGPAKLGSDGLLTIDTLGVLGVSGSETITGPVSLLANAVGTYVLTDYDSFKTYTLTANGGSVVRNGDTITYTAPATGASCGFTINGKAVVIGLVVPYVNAPSITSPVSGTTNVSSSVIITGSAFSTTGQSDTQLNTDWQVASDSGFTNIIAQSLADAVNLTSWTATGLLANTTYYIRARYRGTALSVSDWSTVSSFSTKTSFMPTGQQAKLLASDMAAMDQFGWSVALSGDGNTAAVGADTASPSGLTGAGSVYIYIRSNGTWTQQAKLTASDKTGGSEFGFSIYLSVDGNTAIVGAACSAPSNLTNAGAAYVFTRSGTVWTQQAELMASDKASGDYFGYSVALSSDGNTCVIGANAADISGTQNAGAAYVFTRSGSVWTQQAKLTASDKAAGDQFGESVSLSADGNTALVGSYYATVSGLTNAGAAYVYTRSGTTWTQQAKLIASDVNGSDYFGTSVSLSSDGNTALIGAFTEDPSGLSNAGAAYVYTRSGTTWTQQAKLVASDKAVSDYFGACVSLSSDGNTALIGAFDASPGGLPAAGAAYIFTRSGTTWTQQIKFTASDMAVSNYFSHGVAISGDSSTAIIGAYGADPSGIGNAGAAYIFS